MTAAELDTTSSPQTQQHSQRNKRRQQQVVQANDNDDEDEDEDEDDTHYASDDHDNVIAHLRSDYQEIAKSIQNLQKQNQQHRR